MKVLVACEFSGTVREAFKKAGHDAWSCDLVPTDIPGQHIQENVLGIIDQGWDLLIAHPPCTYLTCAGNIWFKPEQRSRFPNRESDRAAAIDFFMSLVDAPVPRICIENPIRIMSTVHEKPTQIIHPWQFGHETTKATCLWLKGLPELIPTNIVSKGSVFTFSSGKKMSKWFYDASLLPPAERAKMRNKTFQGIADAMASQWGSL